ncbi:MAG: tetratricopeptide repeat protein [candidate division WS1 bacterium]|jgi:tetratricopeptide (TPR) repeat protein|nr:tetratricopeptide repeat protein [candidate division WS1 bacterium]
MSRRDLLLVVLSILGLLVILGLQGCLFGGGGDAEETAEGGEAMPVEGGEAMPAEGGEMGGPPAGMGEDMPADPGMEEPMGEMGEPAGGDASAIVAEALEAKHGGNYTVARQQAEAAVAADPNNGEAHRVLAWIYADMGMKDQAIQEFNAFISIGGDAEDVQEAQAALQRLQ